MLVLIAAAGEGTRFKKHGLSVPKPLIKINNKTLLEHTLSSFKYSQGDTLCIVVQKKHRIPLRLHNLLTHTYPELNIIWIELDFLPQGQLSTCVTAIQELICRDQCFNNEALVIHNCDTGFAWNNGFLPSAGFATIPVFEAEGDHWSFALPDPNNSSIAIRIAEKQRISNLASIGLYSFNNTSDFLTEAKAFLKSWVLVNNEYYIAPMLEKALSKNKIIEIPNVENVKLYGTPSELLKTFGVTWLKLLDENSL